MTDPPAAQNTQCRTKIARPRVSETKYDIHYWRNIQIRDQKENARFRNDGGFSNLEAAPQPCTHLNRSIFPTSDKYLARNNRPTLGARAKLNVGSRGVQKGYYYYNSPGHHQRFVPEQVGRGTGGRGGGHENDSVA